MELKMKVLVTGVAGQLGHDVMNELAKRGYEAIGSDISPEYSGETDGTAVVTMPYVSMDITDSAAVEKTITESGADVVIHCAAWTAVDLAEDEDKIDKVRSINAGGTQNIANVCKKFDCKMVYISTDYVELWTDFVTAESKEEEAARLAKEAGIDAIEVHGDRLLGSLCSTILNHRTDEYGGAFENRIRYALEVVEAIKAAAPGLMIEYKLPIVTENEDGSLRGKGGLVEAEGVEFAKLLEKAGVDMIQVAQANHTGNMADVRPCRYSSLFGSERHSLSSVC